MKRTTLAALWATVLGSATATFAQSAQPTQNIGLDATKTPPAEVRLVYPVEATDAARLEARREPREPVAEKDEYDVETPLGQAREILRLLRGQTEILERLSKRDVAPPVDRTNEVLTAIQTASANAPTLETQAAEFQALRDSLDATTEAVVELAASLETVEEAEANANIETPLLPESANVAESAESGGAWKLVAAAFGGIFALLLAIVVIWLAVKVCKLIVGGFDVLRDAASALQVA
ncbi:MAG: hypothetical protein IKU86_06940, partial [Thermoguttaceae bacterium]|nr:hypothetical protein [Thermoguttaceae bacterium]